MPGGCHLQPGRLCRLLLALDALLRLGQVGGLLGGFACQRVALSGEDGHLLGQLVALGLDLDASGNGLGTRSKRYSMIVENGVVKSLNVEPAPGHDVSSAATMCSLA